MLLPPPPPLLLLSARVHHQLDIIHELSEGMKGCSTAFIAVAVAGIALTLAASTGMEVEDTPEVSTDRGSRLRFLAQGEGL